MASRMPRAPRAVPVEPVNGAQSFEPSTLIEEESATSLPPQVDGLESLMAELSGAIQAKVTVYRIQKSGPQTYVYQCTPEAFSLDDLRDKYGGGDFRLYVTKDGDFYRNLKISVEVKPIVPGAPAPAPSNLTPREAALEARVAEQDKMIQEFCRQNLRPERQSLLGDLDLPATITAISAAIVALRPPAPPPPPPAPEGNVDRAIDMLLKGIELAKELKSESSGEGDSMMGVLRDLIKSPMLAQAVAAGTGTALPAGVFPPTPQALPGGMMPQQPIRAPQPSPQPTQVLPAKLPDQLAPHDMELQLPKAGTPEFDALGPVIVRYLPVLCYKAQEGSSAQLYAEVILDSTPEGMIEPILEHTTGEIIEYLALLYPPLRNEQPWFVSLIDEMRMMLEEDGEGDPIPPDLNMGAPSST